MSIDCVPDVTEFHMKVIPARVAERYHATSVGFAGREPQPARRSRTWQMRIVEH
jgi:hypothetical protein